MLLRNDVEDPPGGESFFLLGGGILWQFRHGWLENDNFQWENVGKYMWET